MFFKWFSIRQVRRKKIDTMFLKNVRSKGKLTNIAENEQNANDPVEKFLIYEIFL